MAPPDRSQGYTIVEVSMIEGRSAEAKKSLIREPYRTTTALGLSAHDREVASTETPRAKLGHPRPSRRRAELPYRVEV